MFSEERVTQMAGYLLTKRGGRMAYIKLLKLLYLAERQAMGRWGESICGDKFVSMPNGPVLSQTYDLIKEHDFHDGESYWKSWIQDEDNYEVSLINPPTSEDFDELSLAERDLLDAIFNKFGQMSRFEIVRYTHDHCPEWEDPNGSSYPIEAETIFRVLGNDDSQIERLVSMNREQRKLDRIKARL